jgi:hypothetical protein
MPLSKSISECGEVLLFGFMSVMATKASPPGALEEVVTRSAGSF